MLLLQQSIPLLIPGDRRGKHLPKATTRQKQLHAKTATWFAICPARGFARLRSPHKTRALAHWLEFLEKIPSAAAFGGGAAGE